MGTDALHAWAVGITKQASKAADALDRVRQPGQTHERLSRRRIGLWRLQIYPDYQRSHPSRRRLATRLKVHVGVAAGGQGSIG